MNLLLLLVALGLAGASPVVDHKVCQPHSRPWQVYLKGKACSGALIDEWWIVTSYDCAPTPYDTIAILGDHDLTDHEGTEQHIYVADAIVHSPYRSPFHSLTLVRLATPASFNEYVQPIPLPSRCPVTGETCYVSGGGSTTPNQYEPQKRLKCLALSVVDDQTCLNTFPEDLYWSHGMICAGQANTDNCIRNKGSLMVCNGQLQGVEWFDHGCDNPTVYTKMCIYNKWINDVRDHYIPETLPTTPEMTT